MPDLPLHVGDTRPIPDPTLLTTQQLLRENQALRELVESRIDALARLTQEQFTGVASTFNQRELRFRQMADDNKAAIAAAFEAWGSLIAKSDAYVAKQIDQQAVLISKSTDVIESKIDDMKQRLTAIESTGEGRNVETAKRQASSNYAV